MWSVTSPCKLDLGLSARNFLFCVARSPTSAAQAEAQHVLKRWMVLQIGEQLMSILSLIPRTLSVLCKVRTSTWRLKEWSIGIFVFFMRLHFSSVLIRYVPRTCNKLAHALSALGVSRQANRQFWHEALPVEFPCSCDQHHCWCN
jgi:hypothetical protein